MKLEAIFTLLYADEIVVNLFRIDGYVRIAVIIIEFK